MKLFFKKLLLAIFYICMFLGFFYILFVNLMCPPVIHTQADAIRRLILALTLSIGLPGIMCSLMWQNRPID